MYENGVAKIIEYIYEDFVSKGAFKDTKRYNKAATDVKTKLDDEAQKIALNLSFAASQQFLYLDF